MFYVYILNIRNHAQWKLCYTMIFTRTFVRDNVLYIHAALLRGKRLFLDREFSYAARLALTAQSESRQELMRLLAKRDPHFHSVKRVPFYKL